MEFNIYIKGDWSSGQPECLWGCSKNWPLDWAIECWVYSKASENTGIEKSARYILKPKEIIPITTKIRKIFCLENNLWVTSFKST